MVDDATFGRVRSASLVIYVLVTNMFWVCSGGVFGLSWRGCWKCLGVMLAVFGCSFGELLYVPCL